LLRKVLSAEERIPFSARQTVVLSTGSDAYATITQEVHLDSTKARITYLMPKSAAGRTVVLDGRWRWEYDPQNKLVIRTSLLRKPVTPLSIDPLVARLQRVYRITVDSRPITVSGRSTYVLRLTPINKDRHTRIWYVDTATCFVLKREVYDIDGSMDTTSVYNSVDFHPKAKPTDITFRLPQGAHLTQRDEPQRYTTLAGARAIAPTWAHVPASLGYGYDFVSAQLVRVKGVQSLHLNYSDVLVSLSLIEMPGKKTIVDAPGAGKPVRVDGANGVLSERTNLHVLSWSHAGKTLTLIADLADAVLLNVARTLQ